MTIIRTNKNGIDRLKKAKKLTPGYRIPKDNPKHNKLKYRRIFEKEYKDIIFNNNQEIFLAIQEDKSNEEIMQIMRNCLIKYVKETFIQENYEVILKDYAINIDEDKKRKLFPNIRDIQSDFLLKMKQNLATYGNIWIDDIRINQTIGNKINNKIAFRIKEKLNDAQGKKESQQLLYSFIEQDILLFAIKEKNININNMPNLKGAVKRRIKTEIEKTYKNSLGEQGDNK